MRNIFLAVIVLGFAGYAISVEKRISAMRLEIGMADVNLVEGDTTLGRPQELNWMSASGSVKLKVFKATAGETSAEWTARIQAYTAQYQAPGQYPPVT